MKKTKTTKYPILLIIVLLLLCGCQSTQQKVVAEPSVEQLMKEYQQHNADRAEIRKQAQKEAINAEMQELTEKTAAENEKMEMLVKEIEEKKGVLSSSEWLDLYIKNTNEINECAKRQTEYANRILELSKKSAKASMTVLEDKEELDVISLKRSEKLNSSNKLPKNPELPYGKKGMEFFSRRLYSGEYDSKNRAPFWVAYQIKKNSSNAAQMFRSELLLDDKTVQNCAKVSDFMSNNPDGFIPVRLVPSDDFKYVKLAEEETRLMSNVVAMRSDFYNNVWKKTDELVRDAVNKFGTVYVVSGPVLTDGDHKTIGTGVAVANYFYKAIMYVQNGEYQGIAMIIPHNYAKGEAIKTYFCSIKELENLLDMRLFTGSGISTPYKLKYDLSKWPVSFSRANTLISEDGAQAIVDTFKDKF